MKKCTLHLLLAGLWCIPCLAQQANKITAFARNALMSRSEEIIAATAEMPADKFGFSPSPQDMTFGQLTLHVADGNYIYCSKIGGLPEPSRPTLSDTDAKEKLVERLHASFDFCKTAFSKLDDSVMSEWLTLGPIKTPRSMAILTLTGTWTDHLSMQTTYLTANGLAPPVFKK